MKPYCLGIHGGQAPVNNLHSVSWHLCRSAIDEGGNLFAVGCEPALADDGILAVKGRGSRGYPGTTHRFGP